MGSTVVMHCLLLCCISAALIGVAQGGVCHDSDDVQFTCPTEKDKQTQVFCCGDYDKQRCCDGEEFKTHGTLNKTIVVLVACFMMFFIVLMITSSCCCCCQGCLLYKYRQRRQGTNVTMTPMQPMAPVPSTDAAGRPLYPTQQYYPPAQQGYPQAQQGYPPAQQGYPPSPYSAESVPLTAHTESGGVYPTKQLSNVPNQMSNQPFTYGPVTKTDHAEYK